MKMNATRANPARTIVVSFSVVALMGERHRIIARERSISRALAGPPEAVHPRRDHRAARPVFLHVGCRAAAHRIRTGIIARIDIGFPLTLPVDRHAAKRPPALCGCIGDGRLRCLHGARTRCRGLGLRTSVGRQKPGQNRHCRRRHNPLHHVHTKVLHPKPAIGPYGLRLPRQGQPGDLVQNQ